MQPFGRTGKDRALFRAGFVAKSDYVVKRLPSLDQVEYAFGPVSRNVDAVFLHHLDDTRVQRAGLKPGALGFKSSLPEMIQIRFGHLAAGAVVHADEKNFDRIHAGWTEKSPKRNCKASEKKEKKK